jgi:hypothetical protein
MPDHRENRRHYGAKRILFTIFVVALGVTSAGAVSKAGNSDSADLRVSLSARDMDVKSALHLIANQVDANLALKDLSGKVSFEVKDGKLRDFMDSFCEAYSCKWSLDGEPFVLLVRSKSKT